MFDISSETVFYSYTYYLQKNGYFSFLLKPKLMKNTSGSYDIETHQYYKSCPLFLCKADSFSVVVCVNQGVAVLPPRGCT